LSKLMAGGDAGADAFGRHKCLSARRVAATLRVLRP